MFDAQFAVVRQSRSHAKEADPIPLGSADDDDDDDKDPIHPAAFHDYAYAH